jgi:O-antigen/teichoic acid export membrane protein
MGEGLRLADERTADLHSPATASWFSKLLTALRTWFSKLRTTLQTSLFRNSIWLLLRSFLSYGLGFVFWLFVARLYDPDDVGLGAAILSMLLLLARGAALGLPTGMLRFLPAEEDKVGLINGAFTVSALTALAVGAVFIAGVSLWAPALALVQQNPLIAVAFIGSLVFFTMDGVIDNAFVAARRADYGMARSTIFFTLRLPLAFVFVGMGVLGILLAWTSSLLVSVVGMAFLLTRLYKGYRPQLTVRSIRRTGILGFSIWTYLTGIVQGAAVFLLPVMILSLPGTWTPADAPENSAYFYAAYTIASLLYLVPQAFSTSLLVEGSHPGNRYTRDVRDTLWLSAPLVFLGIAVVVGWGHSILELFGSRYTSGIWSMLLMVAASPVVLLTSVYSTNLRVEKRVIPIFVITCISTAATLGLAFVLIGRFGILGVAAAFAVGQIIMVPLFLAEKFVRARAITAAESVP